MADEHGIVIDRRYTIQTEGATLVPSTTDNEDASPNLTIADIVAMTGAFLDEEEEKTGPAPAEESCKESSYEELYEAYFKPLPPKDWHEWWKTPSASTAAQKEKPRNQHASLSLTDIQKRLRARADQLKAASESYELGRLLEEVSEKLTQHLHSSITSNSVDDAGGLAEEAYSTVMEPALGALDLDEMERSALLCELTSVTKDMMECREGDEGWQSVIDATVAKQRRPLYDLINLSDSKRPMAIMVDEVAEIEKNRLIQKLDNARKEARAKNLPLPKMTPLQIRILQGRYSTAGYEPTNGRFERATLMREGALYFSWNRAKKEKKVEEVEFDVINLDDSDYEVIDDQEDDDQEQPSRISRRVQRRQSQRILDKITQGLHLFRINDKSCQAVSPLLQRHSPAAQWHEKRQQQLAAAKERRAREKEARVRSRSVDFTFTTRARREFQPQEGEGGFALRRQGVQRLRESHPQQSTSARQRSSSTSGISSILRCKRHSHSELTVPISWDNAEQTSIGRDGASNRSTRIVFSEESPRIHQIKSFGKFKRTGERDSMTKSPRGPMITRFTRVVEARTEADGGGRHGMYLLPSRDEPVFVPKGINPDEPINDASIAASDAAYDELVNEYRFFTATARAYERRRISRWLISDSLLGARLDSAYLTNTYFTHIKWPVLPHWFVGVLDDEEKTVTVKSDEDKLTRFPLQITTIFVALGLDLITMYHDKETLQVLDFLDDFRDKMEEILGYPLGNQIESEVYSKHISWEKGDDDCETAVYQDKQIFQHGGLRMVVITIPEIGHEQFVNLIRRHNNKLRAFVQEDERRSPDSITVELLDWAKLVADYPNQSAMKHVDSRIDLLMVALRERYAVMFDNPYGIKQ